MIFGKTEHKIKKNLAHTHSHAFTQVLNRHVAVKPIRSGSQVAFRAEGRALWAKKTDVRQKTTPPPEAAKYVTHYFTKITP